MLTLSSGLLGEAMLMSAKGEWRVNWRFLDLAMLFSWVTRCLFRVWLPSSTISIYLVVTVSSCLTILLKGLPRQ